ncbi:hypothetical protein I3842_05G121200 [Carya illinoinensis]|uniref:Uncharacterized protein n=1 Tax=Carya illinoinensis TaxID=32201 RepID=A0A922EYP7_CARIL|nr:hypothetical protein I3842_05G121200 [Carya illinoinensis]
MHASSWKLFLECLRVVHLLVWCKTRLIPIRTLKLTVK